MLITVPQFCGTNAYVAQARTQLRSSKFSSCPLSQVETIAVRKTSGVATNCSELSGHLSEGHKFVSHSPRVPLLQTKKGGNEDFRTSMPRDPNPQIGRI